MTVMSNKQEDIVKALRLSADVFTEVKRVFTRLNASEDIIKGFDTTKNAIHMGADEIIRLNTLLHDQNVRKLEEGLRAKDPDPNGENIENYCKRKGIDND